MSDRNLQDLHPDLRDLYLKWENACHALGVDVFVTETYRSKAEQNADYAQGRTKPGHIITNAKGGESPHNCTMEDGTPCSRAFDFAIKGPDGVLDWNAKDDAWQTAIRVGQELGLVSGSTWSHLKDNPHFELFNWRTYGR